MNENITATQLLELIEACCREWFEAQKNEYEANNNDKIHIDNDGEVLF